MPPPIAVRRWQESRRIYVRPRTAPQPAHLWWPAMAKLQAASVPIAKAAARHGTDRRTDRAIPKCPPPLRRGAYKVVGPSWQECADALVPTSGLTR